MKYSLLIALALLLGGTYLFADAGGTEPTFFPAATGKYIKLDAKGALCGQLTITPKGSGFGAVILKAYRTYGEDEPTGDNLLGTDKLEDVGKTYAYSYGGGTAGYSYRISCQQETGGVTQGNCKDLVQIEKVYHNRPCGWWFGAGIAIPWGKLNMN